MAESYIRTIIHDCGELSAASSSGIRQCSIASNVIEIVGHCVFSTTASSEAIQIELFQRGSPGSTAGEIRSVGILRDELTPSINFSSVYVSGPRSTDGAPIKEPIYYVCGDNNNKITFLLSVPSLSPGPYTVQFYYRIADKRP